MLPVEDDFQYMVMPFVDKDNAKLIMVYADKFEMGKLMFAAFYMLHLSEPERVWEEVEGMELGKFGWKCLAEYQTFRKRAAFTEGQMKDVHGSIRTIQNYHVIDGFCKLRKFYPPLLRLDQKEAPRNVTLYSSGFVCKMGHVINLQSTVCHGNWSSSLDVGLLQKQLAFLGDSVCLCGCMFICSGGSGQVV